MAARGATCAPRAAAGGSGRRPRGAAQQRTRPPPPQQPQPLTPWSGSEALLSFVADAGGWVHPALVVGSRGGGGAGRGVFVKADVPPGPLAYVPCAACPTGAAAAAAAAGALWAPGGPLAALPPLAAAEQLALQLLLRARAPGADRDAYVASLPRLQDGAMASFPASWSDAQRSALGDKHLAAQFAAWASRNAAQHAALAPALGAPSLALHDWLWANAMVLSRAFRWHDGADTSLQPFIDCVNHPPFQTRDDAVAAAAAPRRNAMYCYVPAGADVAKWPCLPERAAQGGAAALTLLRLLRSGDEVLTSYAQEQTGGRLPAQAALARYGFLPALLSDADAPHDVHPADARNAALEMRIAAPAFAAGGVAGGMRAVGAALGGAAARDEGAARRAAGAGDEAARIAALYRRGRGLALGRAALPHLLPQGGRDGGAAAAAMEGLRAGVAAGVAAAAHGGALASGGGGGAADAAEAGAFQDTVWHALAGEEPTLLTPEEAILAARAWGGV
jgi:hypothetical protein